MYKHFHILYCCIAALFVAIACDEQQFPFVSKKDYDLSIEENQLLRDSLNDTHSLIEKQNKDLAYILSELSSLSSRSVRLRVDAERASLSSMQMIQEDLDALKEKLNRLEGEAAKVRSLDRKLAVSSSTIKMLRETIGLQQDEIDRLKTELLNSKETIRAQQNTIAVQGDTIRNQMEILSEQRKKLTQTVQEQTLMLFDAGRALADIADEGNFKITGNRNRLSVRQYRQTIYNKAIDYYQMASLGGHPDARDSMLAVVERLKEL